MPSRSSRHHPLSISRRYLPVPSLYRSLGASECLRIRVVGGPLLLLGVGLRLRLGGSLCFIVGLPLPGIFNLISIKPFSDVTSV